MRRCRGAPRAALVCALAWGVVMAGCGGVVPPAASWVGESGVAVWLADGVSPAFPLQDIERALELTAQEFPERWPAREAGRHATEARILLVDGAYRLDGRDVAGHVDRGTLWMKVAVRPDEPLSDTALVHEIVHYLDLATHGGTDDTHESWNGRVFEGIERVRATLRSEEAPDACIAF